VPLVQIDLDRRLADLGPLGGWIAIDRMRRGEPAVVHGDGTPLWMRA